MRKNLPTNRSVVPFHSVDRASAGRSKSRRAKRHCRIHRQEPLERREMMSGEGLGAAEITALAITAGGYRSIDGTGNNLSHPEWGSTAEQLLRRAPASYGDRIATPAGANRPSPRVISNTLVQHGDEETANERNLTAYLYVWGQFLDHDMDLTRNATPADPFFINVPTGDEQFDPNSAGTAQIPFFRSAFDPATGRRTSNPRQQTNDLTAWIDGSMVYGSDAVRAAALRTFSGGQMRVSTSDTGDLPPLNTFGLPNDNPLRAPADSLYLAGDERANENIELTAMHTLFLREHNRIASALAANNSQLNDEELYQRARAYVVAEIQAVTYNEWLPALVGRGVLSSYRGYNSGTNPGIANEFSTAAFRLHSTINDDVEFFDNDGRPITFTYVDEGGAEIEVDGEVALRDAFFNPGLFSQTGVDGILKYAASTHAEELDSQLVDSLRNFLFGQPGQGGLDLASLNIQRGRDHGLADYNTTRASYGLPRVRTFADITSDTEVQAKLAELYGNVNNIDLWVGVTAEDHVRGSTTGPLMQKVLLDQFQRLRDGDRYWYERNFSGSTLDQLRRTQLSDIIERNTGVDGLQENVFFFQAFGGGTVFRDSNGNGRHDQREDVVRNVRLELLNDEGEVVAATRTARDGTYAFDQFGETGDYQVRIADVDWTVTTAHPRDFLVASGDVRIRNLHFGVRPARNSLAAADNVASTTDDQAGDWPSDVDAVLSMNAVDGTNPFAKKTTRRRTT